MATEQRNNMSGKSTNKKMQNAFQRVGKALGFDFKVYRALDHLTPIQTKNYIVTKKVGAAPDTSFQQPVGSSYKQVNLFTNTEDLKTGDILVNEELGKVYVLVNKDPIVAPQAIETTDKLTFSRPGYTTAGSFAAGLQEFAKDIPAAIYGVDTVANPSVVGEVKNASGNNIYSIWVWLPQNFLKINDTITDSYGNKSLITSIEYSPVGYKLSAKSIKV